MKIACFGDSLTFGSVGYSYIKYLDSKYKVINKGVNGDTTVCAYKRMKRYIEKPANNDTDVYVVAIGINDMLAPYLTTVSPLWKMQMTPRVKIKKCIKDDMLFETEYQKFLELILNHKKRAIAVGLPLIQLKGFPNEAARKRNNIIKKLAEQHHVPFIDAALLQQQSVSQISFSYSWGNQVAVRILDDIIMLVLPFTKDWFSKIRRLELTVDGVHYNSLSARLIGDAINDTIKSADNEPV